MRPALSTFVYDGDCAFCSSSMRFVERFVLSRHHAAKVRIVPWQFADVDALGLTEAECEQTVHWVASEGSRAAGPDAFAQLLLIGGRPCWRQFGWLLRRRSARALAWPAYRWVARNRHRLPGGTPACAVPLQEGPRRP